MYKIELKGRVYTVSGADLERVRAAGHKVTFIL